MMNYFRLKVDEIPAHRVVVSGFDFLYILLFVPNSELQVGSNEFFLSSAPTS